MLNTGAYLVTCAAWRRQTVDASSQETLSASRNAGFLLLLSINRMAVCGLQAILSSAHGYIYVIYTDYKKCSPRNLKASPVRGLSRNVSKKFPNIWTPGRRSRDAKIRKRGVIGHGSRYSIHATSLALNSYTK